MDYTVLFLSVVVGFLVVFATIIYGSIKYIQDKMNELSEEVYGTSYKKSINFKIQEIKNKTDNYSDNLKQILKGLPNLFKDDLDLYKEVNGYDHYFLTLDNLDGGELSVVFYCDRRDNSYYVNQSPAYAVSWVLNKVEEYKQVKEKCCPKKGKK